MTRGDYVRGFVGGFVLSVTFYAFLVLLFVR